MENSNYIFNNINNCDLTQFIGTEVCDTIGLVIANVDPAIRERMGFEKTYPSLGIIGSRTGAGAQIKAVDDAAKSTNIEVLSIELPRDTKSGGGHGNLILMGSDEISSVTKAVELSLEYIHHNAGELYITDAGHLEFQYTARAGAAIYKAFGAPLDKAWGFICASPAPIGLVIADIALKTSGVEIVSYYTPSKGTSHSNEVITTITGDSSAVHQAVLAAREAGIKLLGSLGPKPESLTQNPYL